LYLFLCLQVLRICIVPGLSISQTYDSHYFFYFPFFFLYSAMPAFRTIVIRTLKFFCSCSRDGPPNPFPLIYVICVPSQGVIVCSFGIPVQDIFCSSQISAFPPLEEYDLPPAFECDYWRLPPHHISSLFFIDNTPPFTSIPFIFETLAPARVVLISSPPFSFLEEFFVCLYNCIRNLPTSLWSPVFLTPSSFQMAS